MYAYYCYITIYLLKSVFKYCDMCMPLYGVGVHMAFYGNSIYMVIMYCFQLEKLVTKNFYLFKSAKEAYRSYIQAYASHSLKSVFSIDQLDLAKVAKSFGFQVPPAVNLTVTSSNKNSKKLKSEKYRNKKVRI